MGGLLFGVSVIHCAYRRETRKSKVINRECFTGGHFAPVSPGRALSFLWVIIMKTMPEVYAEISKNVAYMKDGTLVWVNPSQRNDRIGREVGSIDRGGYRYTNFCGKTVLVHRLVFFIHNGYLPRIVDHINRDRLDNRIENLRDCASYAANGWNAEPRIGFTSKYKGVSRAKTKGKWRASANYNKKPKYLGYFDDENEAAIAYNKFAMEHYGEYAVLNEIDI